jgi:phage gp45-like
MIGELGAKLRNLFVTGEFQKRYTDGDKKDFIQVRTHNGRVVEKKEAFPYGFCAKAKNGGAFVFCQGGNPDGFEIFPVRTGDGVTLPELEEGDTALYTDEGGFIIAREAGGIEVTAKGEGDVLIKTDKGTVAIKKDGKIYLGNEQINSCALIIGLIDEIEGLILSGAPPSHTVSPASRQKLEAYKEKVKQLHAEAE